MRGFERGVETGVADEAGVVLDEMMRRGGKRGRGEERRRKGQDVGDGLGERNAQGGSS